jgi:hypothetical protein
MSNVQTTVPATVETVAAKVPFKLAPVSATASHDFAATVAKAFKKAETDHEKIEKSLALKLHASASAIGVPMTQAQYQKQFAPQLAKEVKRRMKGSPGEANALTQAKTFVLAVCAKPHDWQAQQDALEPDARTLHFSDVLAGENAKTYHNRVFKLLESAKLPNGEWIMPHSETGEPVKGAGRPTETPEAKAAKEKAAKEAEAAKRAPESAGDVAKTEGGMNRSAPIAAALILTGDDECLARRLAYIAETFPERLDKFMVDLLKIEAPKVLLATEHNRKLPKPPKAA